MDGSASVYFSNSGSSGLKHDLALFFEIIKMLDELHSSQLQWVLHWSGYL